MGALVHIVAPAGPVNPDRLDAGIRFLRSLGLEIREGRFLRGRWGHLAGRDEERAADLMHALLDPEADLVWAARGGFGCLRLLPLLDWTLLAARSKPRPPLIGYSDLTSLQNILQARLSWPCWHAPMPASELAEPLDAVSAASLDGMLAALIGGQRTRIRLRSEESGEWTLRGGDAEGESPAQLVIEGAGFTQELELGDAQVWVGGVAQGKLFGGNLSVLTSLFGSAWCPDMPNGLLLLEDHGEYPFRLDRHLAQLRNSGVLASAGGILLGPFLRCEEPDADKSTFTADELLRQYLLPLGVPVLTGLPFGHQAPRICLPLGGSVQVRA